MMKDIVAARQYEVVTKGAADRLNLTPPRHISTLPLFVKLPKIRKFRSAKKSYLRMPV
jgi:hypothetical protein